jgi:hypothetical protein
MAVVGRTEPGGQTTKIVKEPVGAAGVTPEGAMSAAIARRVGASVPGLVLSPSSIPLISTLTPEQLGRLAKIIRKSGQSVRSSVGSIKTLLLTDPVYTKFAAESLTFADLYSKIEADYIPGLDDKKAKEPALPSRQIYQYKKEDIFKVIDEVYQTTLGRTATPQELEERYAPLEKQINQGTLSTTKEKVLNKKTGKYESVTTQTPAYSAESAKTSIEEELKKANPDEYDRNKRIEFSDWLSKNTGV